MFGIGLPELVIVLVIVLVLFGAGRIPAVMKDLGKGVYSFKEGLMGKTEPKRAVAHKTSSAKGGVRKKLPALQRKVKPASKRRQ